MNTKLHAVTDTAGRPIRFFMTAGEVSDYTGARALVSSLPAADWLLGPSRDHALHDPAGQRIGDMTRTGSARPLLTKG
jgi:transposase